MLDGNSPTSLPQALQQRMLDHDLIVQVRAQGQNQHLETHFPRSPSPLPPFPCSWFQLTVRLAHVENPKVSGVGQAPTPTLSNEQIVGVLESLVDQFIEVHGVSRWHQIDVLHGTCDTTSWLQNFPKAKGIEPALREMVESVRWEDASPVLRVRGATFDRVYSVRILSTTSPAKFELSSWMSFSAWRKRFEGGGSVRIET